MLIQNHLLVSIFIMMSLLIFPGTPGKAEISKDIVSYNRTRVPAITKKDLVRINQDTIKRRNLTLDWDLQQFIAETSAKYKLYYGSIAVMDARTGDVLALYGQTLSGQDCSLGLYPELAASVFKMVTAVAAMEQAGFSSQSTFFYCGNPYTLYRKQVSHKKDRWCSDITLANAFARSNNIVFGKLGSIYLGQTPLIITAEKMGFGKPVLRELESKPSTSFIPEDDYNLAELASGFNRRTRISPLHAAQMATAVLNSGYMITPRIVRTPTGDMVKHQVMSKETAQSLSAMMERTVKAGTVAKTFRGASSDRVLEKLAIGGKSGSINGDQPKGRRNWFVSYVRDKDTGEEITIGCLLILNDRFRIDADVFSRLIIRHYFSKPVSEARSALRDKRMIDKEYNYES